MRFSTSRDRERPLRTEPEVVTQRVYLNEEQWIEKFEAFLKEQHCSTFGRGFDIHSESGRRVCAEWLAHAAAGAQVL